MTFPLLAHFHLMVVSFAHAYVTLRSMSAECSSVFVCFFTVRALVAVRGIFLHLQRIFFNDLRHRDIQVYLYRCCRGCADYLHSSRDNVAYAYDFFTLSLSNFSRRTPQFFFWNFSLPMLFLRFVSLMKFDFNRFWKKIDFGNQVLELQIIYLCLDWLGFSLERFIELQGKF